MAKKKEFVIDNPALKFLNTDNTQYTHNTDNADTTQNAHNTQETKSKRLNLLLYPSVLDDLKKIATMQRRSVNDLINEVLSDYITQEAAQLQRYNDVFTE